MMNCKVRLRGEYKFRKIRALTGEVTLETGWQKNLITNVGLDQIGALAAVGNYCRIGTGNTTPANTDTALVSQSGSTSTQVSGSQSVTGAGSPNYETITSVTYQFPLGSVVGNMAEVGVGWAATGSTLFSRALIVDSGGSPTTITVLSGEILQVVYRLTIYPPLGDQTGTVTVSGVSYSFLARTFSVASPFQMGVTSYGLLGGLTNIYVYGSASTLSSITGSGPSGSGASVSFGAWSAYTAGNYYRDYSITADIAIGNVTGGIGALALQVSSGSGSTGIHTQMSFGTPIPKDNTKQFSMTFRQSWARH